MGLYQEHSASNRRLFKLWEESSGQKKIALNCPDGSELVSSLNHLLGIKQWLPANVLKKGC